MWKFVILLTFISVGLAAYAQDEEHFPFGKVTSGELAMTVYPEDTTAKAVVLREFGHAYIQSDPTVSLVFTYHVKVKILKTEGLDLANVVINTFRRGSDAELVGSIQASSYELENGLIKETKLSSRQIFQEDVDKNWQSKKFAIPNVKVGSIIEYAYELTTPFFYQNFRPWEFQSSIPKIASEYWATIPANWRYNIALRGYLAMKKNESKVLQDYFRIGSGKADAVKYMWLMEKVPAFVEEEYMTAKKNFLSRIDFELLQIEYFDGRKDKVTKEWKDVEQELRQWDKFGIQLKRGKDIVEETIERVIANETDQLTKARKIFDFMRGWYQWNGNYQYFSESGIKKAFDARKGNIADINLSLIASLRYAGLHTEPVLLSTRDNGWPTDLFPVLTEFNYVVAKVNIDNKSYLLDASEDFLPFGVLPMRCLNGRGRVLGDKESYWYDLKPVEKFQVISQVTLEMADDGTLAGSVKNTYLGYRAADKRRTIAEFASIEAYVKEKQSTNKAQLSNMKLTNVDDVSKPLVEEYSIELESPMSSGRRSGFFNPFFIDRWETNPFRSMERLYPVDFGVPIEQVLILSMTLPPSISPVDLPEKFGVILPNSGGRFLYQVQTVGQKLYLNTNLSVSRDLYSPGEYAYLREFFNQVVKAQSTDLVFEKKM